MRLRQVFEYILIELNKVKAPTLLLDDFNYYFNKSLIQYVNKIYNVYEINQQKTDDLRVLHSTAVLNPTIQNIYPNLSGTPVISNSNLFKNTYNVFLPDDYLHILNCVVEYKVLIKNKCYNINDYIQFGAKKLNSDQWSQILNNYYFKPSYKNPYFYISNVNTNNNYPTEDNITNIILPSEKISGERYGNSSKVRMEIRYGKDISKFQLNKVYVDYLKSPKYICLTEEQLDNIEDTSEILEFPDYVINEIINGLLAIIFENTSNPRLQTNIPISQSINPTK